MEIGFDNKKYVKIQSEKIKERFTLFDKLYLEVGGKLFDDSHAARILPGFKNDVKISMFKELKKDLEIIFCINAGDIEKNKTRGEYGITYDQEILKLINNSKKMGFSVNSVVVTLYKNQVSVDKFIKKLNRNGIKTYIHTFTKGYPTDVDTIVSEEGYGANPYIETTKKLILVNAPGPGSGKLATCLSQIYHENKRGVNAGYAKFETFPVWNLPLKHPVNLAYEAATADLKDVNMIDPFHLEKYGTIAVNYNRDVETFPILKNILSKVSKKDIYNSPTDMGVNMVGFCITNESVVEEASKKEIVRRYYNELNNYKMGLCDEDTYKKIKLLMNELKIDENYLDVIKPALEKKEKENGLPVIAIDTGNRIITGKQTDLMTPAGTAVLNALKHISRIPDIYLLSPTVLEPILKLKKDMGNNERLTLSEVLTALSICSVTNPVAYKALKNIKKLQGLEAHSTYIVTGSDRKTLKELKINLTCENDFLEENL
ncbi:MAG: DUF1846 domain-containing protein [Bacilli bacterium]|nr:DUF1846 domain-containing protein [Bacilli bacterium]MBR6137532.1 DUF1846 domain-containing protein [Bacilli bacterium]MBR6949952.1 DUF1846 domain-containing protein [Bacilli bacterium]